MSGPARTAVVVGAGAMGAAAARVLAERGWGVTLLEQHAIGHDLGGSGHETRSFRLSHSDADDVRLAVRALELWNDLERRGGETLLLRNGLLQRGSVVPPMAAALREAGVRFDELDHRDVSRLFPEMRPQPDAPAIFQPDGAVILARRSILVQVRLACAAGAVVHEGEKCITLSPQGDGVRAFTRRRRIDADVAVVCAGPWSLPLLVPLGLRLPLQAGLAQVTSFRSLYSGWEQRPGLMERTAGPGVYGMPELRRGYKLGWATINPMTFWKASKVRPYDRENEQALVERVRQDFPGFDPTPLRHEAGPITLVPDELFVIDRRGPIVVGAACIGHAFKFSPVLGELFADLAEQRPLPPEARRFGLDRPTLAPERRSGRVAVGA
jgi:sarcosine oxidase